MARRRRYAAEDFGPAVERLMNETGVTYRALAAKTDLSAGYLNHLVHGNRPVPSNEVVEALAVPARPLRVHAALCKLHGGDGEEPDGGPGEHEDAKGRCRRSRRVAHARTVSGPRRRAAPAATIAT